MNSSVNPALWANWNLRAKDQQFDTKLQVLLSQISQWAQQMQAAVTPLQLASTLNGSSLIQGTALDTISTNFGTVSTNQTQNCAGATSVTIGLAITAAITLNLTHLSNSVPALIRCVNNSGGALVFKIAGTNAAGTALSVSAVFVSGGAETDMTGTGFNQANGTAQSYVGMAIAGTLLIFHSL